LAQELSSQYCIKVEVLQADLADPAQLRSVENVLSTHADLTMLINNAGIGDIARFAIVDRDATERMLQINVVALTRLTHAALPPMIARGGGVIINVASGLAFDVMEHGMSVYGGSKAYVAHFTQILHEEVKDSNIRLQVLVPGLTRTNLGGAQDSGFFDQFPADWVMSPESVAQASLRGLELGELFCFPRLDDYSQWVVANAAIRAVGKSPPTNHVAQRYQK
jgi:uncharacterized protein